MALSISKANVNGVCLLNAGGNALIKRFLNIFAKGEEGIKNEIDAVLYSIGLDIETASPQQKKDYAVLLMNWHRQQYSDPRRVEEMKPSLTVVINEMGPDGEVKEVQVVPCVDSTPFKNGEVDKAAYRVLEERRIDQTEGDPDSLFTSPMIDELKKGLPRLKGSSAEERNTTHGKGGRFVSLKGVKKSVPEQDSRAEVNEPGRVKREPEELAEASEVTGGGA